MGMLAAALLLAATNQTAIDYETVAKPLAAVLQELSELSGVEMRASKPLENELLVIRVRNVDADELRNHIADALTAKWSNENGTWFLNPDATALRKRAEALRKSYAAQFSKAAKEFQDHHEEEFRKLTEGDLVDAAKSFVAPDFAGRVFARALRQLDPNEIVGLAEDSRCDYSTTNNRNQRPMRGLAPLLQATLALQHKYADAAARADVDEPEVGTYSYSVRQAVLRKWSGPIRAVVSMTWEYGGLNARCYLIDASSRVVDDARFDFSYDLGDPLEIPEVLGKASHKFTPDTIAFEQFSEIRTGTRLEDFERGFLARVQKPTSSDPLSFTVSESLTEVGRLCNWNVVARPIDEMYDGNSTRGEWTLGNWLAEVQQIAALRISFKDDWLTMGSSGYRSRPQVDRRALETLIEQGRDRIPTLQEFAAYSLKSANSILELMYVPPFAGYVPDWTWYKLYAKLPEDVRSLLWNGVPMRVSDLPADARRHVEWIIFNTDGYSQAEDPVDWTYETPPITDLLPNGLPAYLTLRPTASSGFCLLSTKPRSVRSRSYARPLDQVAEAAARRQLTDGLETAAFPSSLWPCVFGKVRELELSLHIAGLEYGDTLQDVDLSRKSKEYTGPELPADVQKEFDKAARRHLKRLKDDGGGR